MSILVVGSVAIDDIETPHEKAVNVLGGSAVYIAVAASYFLSPVRLVGIIGSVPKRRCSHLAREASGHAELREGCVPKCSATRRL